MVNTTQFYKTKVALAVVLSLGLAACGDSEGDAGSTSTSTAASTTDATQNTVGNQDDLSGTVSGTVLDTNGNPVVGATVFLGGEETTTDAGGHYIFTDVPVVNVAGVNNEGGEGPNNVGTPLVITIAAEGHMGASVTVFPQAQVNNTGGVGAGGGASSVTTIQTYIDGFTIQAGTAQLPAISKRVYGFLRDCDTNGPLEGGTVAFDFQTVNGGPNIALGISTTNNAAGAYTTVTDADGMFDIMLPADSTLKFLVNGYLSTDTDGNEFGAPDVNDDISTNDEQIDLFLGTVEVCPVEFEAEPGPPPAAPFIASVAGQIGTSEIVGDGDSTYDVLADHNGDGTDTVEPVTYNYAALNQGVVNDFVISFSEEMASTFDLSEARVKVDGDSIQDATVTLSAEGDSVTVTFVDDLDENSKIDVWFPFWTATDANDDLFLIDNAAIGYDTGAIETSSKAFYVHAFLCTFEKPTDEASVELGPQIFDADDDEDGDSSDLAEYSTAFQDNDAGDVTPDDVITQLNDGDGDTGDRLLALALARGIAIDEIISDYAVVEFDSDAASLIWDPMYDEIDGDTAHFEDVEHGDEISVTPVNGFGDVLSSGEMEVTLVDAITPTTVLQESYNITDPAPATGAAAPRSGLDVVSGTTGNAEFGNGGEISASGDVGTSRGNPIIHIQPRHLAGQVSGAAVRNSELDSLTSGMSARLSAAELTAFGAGAATALSQSTIATHIMPVYDAMAFAAWDAIPGTIGVAFSEDVSLTSSSPVFDGSTSLSGYAALEDVSVDVDGNEVDVDLVTFVTPDVVALSLDAGADLSFVGAVEDRRDNVATANAQVFIQDTFPPMMTAAVWDGVLLTLTFNEPVVIPAGGTAITVHNPSDPDVDAEIIAVTTGNSVASGNQLIITLTGAQNTDVSPLFVDGADDEFLYNDDANAVDEEQHALIDWDGIADETGNQWSEFNPTLSSSDRGMEAGPIDPDTRRWEVVAPRFLAVNAVGPFTYSVQTSGYLDANAANGDDDGTVTYTLSFTHPIDVANANAFSTPIAVHPSYTLPITTLISESTATAAGVTLMNALFTIDFGDDGADAFVIATTPVSATEAHGAFALSADYRVITLTITGLADVAGSILFNTTEVGLATLIDSSITGTQTASGTFVWQNTN